MTYEELSSDYWKYYKMLESRFLESLNFVELDYENYNVYSIEFANQLNSIGSELDLFFKVASKFGLDERKDISDYYKKINEYYPDIKNQEIIIVDKKNMKIKPFEFWSKNKPSQSLKWWEAYNNVKHGRVLNKKEANLENVLNILGALFILEMYLFKDIYDNSSDNDKKLDIPKDSSELFNLENWETRFHAGPITFETIQIEDDKN